MSKVEIRDENKFKYLTRSAKEVAITNNVVADNIAAVFCVDLIFCVNLFSISESSLFWTEK